MAHRYLCMLVTIWVISGPLTASITEITDLQPFEQAIADFGSEDLILSDVDNVLIVPNDIILRPPGKQFFKDFLTKPFDDQLWGYLMQNMTVSLVDERMPEIVRQVQQGGVPMLALTASWSGPLGPVASAADWRIENLKDMGYDFSAAFAEFGEWQHENAKLPDHPLTFKQGILFSPRQPKGKTLTLFLQALGWQPKRIVFIDDRLDFLQSVEAAAMDLGIAFQGFHYTAVYQLPGCFDAQIAEQQLRHLVEHKEWLNDDHWRARAVNE